MAVNNSNKILPLRLLDHPQITRCRLPDLAAQLVWTTAVHATVRRSQAFLFGPQPVADVFRRHTVSRCGCYSWSSLSSFVVAWPRESLKWWAHGPEKWADGPIVYYIIRQSQRWLQPARVVPSRATMLATKHNKTCRVQLVQAHLQYPTVLPDAWLAGLILSLTIQSTRAAAMSGPPFFLSISTKVSQV